MLLVGLVVLETRKIKNLGTAHTYGPTLERLKQEDWGAESEVSLGHGACMIPCLRENHEEGKGR